MKSNKKVKLSSVSRSFNTLADSLFELEADKGNKQDKLTIHSARV